MEMPKGWDKAMRDAELEAGSGYSEFVPSGKNFIVGLKIMREMAEALDDMVKACHQGYGRDIKKMERALEKFKGWR